jgi:hypothetical protein
MPRLMGSSGDYRLRPFEDKPGEYYANLMRTDRLRFWQCSQRLRFDADESMVLVVTCTTAHGCEVRWGTYRSWQGDSAQSSRKVGGISLIRPKTPVAHSHGSVCFSFARFLVSSLAIARFDVCP